MQLIPYQGSTRRSAVLILPCIGGLQRLQLIIKIYFTDASAWTFTFKIKKSYQYELFNT